MICKDCDTRHCICPVKGLPPVRYTTMEAIMDADERARDQQKRTNRAMHDLLVWMLCVGTTDVRDHLMWEACT